MARPLTGCRAIQVDEISSSTDFLCAALQCPVPVNAHFLNYVLRDALTNVRGRRSIRHSNVQIPASAVINSVPVVPAEPVLEPTMPPLLRPVAPLNNHIKPAASSTMSTQKSLMILLAFFSIFVISLLHVYSTFPNLTEEEKVHVKLPTNREDAKQLGIVLDRYKDDNYHKVLLGVSIVYIFLQTFAIPGSLFLSILSGFLFPFPLALILVCSCSALGATLCFLVSQLVGKRLVCKWYPEKVDKWAVTINKQRDNLFNYVVFLRVTPFLPNWFINLTAPIVGVPVKPFVLGTFFGVAPPSFIAIQTGQTLHSVADTAGISWTSIMLLTLFAVVSIIPIFLKQRLKKKFE